MRKHWLLAIAAGTFAIGVAACTGADDDDDDTSPTPTPTALDVLVTGTGFGPAIGQIAGVRVLDPDAGDAVVFCTTTTLGSPVFTVGTQNALAPQTMYVTELWVGSDATYDPASDLEWSVPFTTATSAVTLTIVYDTANQSAITWTQGQACPGD